MNEQLPGYDFAQSKGYFLVSHSGRNDDNLISSATYVKEGNFLTIKKDGIGVLEKILGLITCSTGEFSIPNKNFEAFEKQLDSVIMIKIF